MKVYVLMGHVEFEYDYVVGIYLSKEEAESKIWNNDGCYSTVEEHEVIGEIARPGSMMGKIKEEEVFALTKDYNLLDDILKYFKLKK